MAVANKELVKDEKSIRERFADKVFAEFSENIPGTLQVTDFQKQLIQGYFIAINRALEVAEDNRIKKNANNKDPKYNNDLPVVWGNVNLKDLALDVIHYARMGLDMMQDNHLSAIPFKNNKNRNYDMTLIPGYNGISYIAEKYAVTPPSAVTIELVYDSDTFIPHKKSMENKIEGYEFEINNPFNRGEIIGGFGYIEYADPLKNKLIIMTLKDILKRKPTYASAEFWGGKSKRWEGGKLVEVELDGWFEEMCLKTIKREVYSAKNIPRDPKKIDDAYQYMKAREARCAELEAQAEIDKNANLVVLDTAEIEDVKVVETTDPETGEILDFIDEKTVSEPEAQETEEKPKTTKRSSKEAAEAANTEPSTKELNNGLDEPDF